MLVLRPVLVSNKTRSLRPPTVIRRTCDGDIRIVVGDVAMICVDDSSCFCWHASSVHGVVRNLSVDIQHRSPDM